MDKTTVPTNLPVNATAAKQADEIHGRQLDDKRHSSEVIYSSSDQNDSKVTAGEEDRKRDTEPKKACRHPSVPSTGVREGSACTRSEAEKLQQSW